MTATLIEILSRTNIIGKKTLDNTSLVEENGEALVRVKEYVPDVIERMSNVRFYWTVGQGLPTDMFLRETVAKKLACAAEKLRPNYRIVISDAWRPKAYQQWRFDCRCEAIKGANPELSDAEVKEQAFAYVAQPDDNPIKAAPHQTGGAVDLTLYDTKTLSLVDMGTRIGDFSKEEILTNHLGISPQARENRVMLIESMFSEGLTNYPGEWWHFTYGEREWAAYDGFSLAIYAGVDELPEKLRK